MTGTFQAALAGAADALDALGLTWAVTGSLALNYHGLTRATHDIDIKVLAPPHEPLADEIAMRSRGGFLVRDEGMLAFRDVEIELYPLDGEIDRMSLERRVQVPLFAGDGRAYWVVTVEDLILSKLREFRRHGDAKHVSDVRHLVAARRADLDRAYLFRRLEEEVLADAWDEHVETVPDG